MDRVRADLRKADTTFLDEEGFHDLFQRVRHASSKEFERNHTGLSALCSEPPRTLRSSIFTLQLVDATQSNISTSEASLDNSQKIFER